MLSRLASAVVMALVLPFETATAGDLSGAARVIDGQTLEVAGKRVRLYGIDAPALGSTCEIAGRRVACGRISRSALMDLTAGAEVTCAAVAGAADVAVCRAGNYCLSEGMTYTGWARADVAVTEHYRRFEEDARRHRRGLWRRVRDD